MKSLTLRLRLEGPLLSVKLVSGEQNLAEDKVEFLNTGESKSLAKLVATERNISRDLPVFSKRLGALLFPSRVRQKWETERNGQPLRTLLDVAVPELEVIPWELASFDGRLFLRSEQPFARVVGGKEPAPLRTWPIDVLIVLGSKPSDLEKIRGDLELREIRNICRPCNRTIHVHILRQPSRSEIVNALRNKPHVFHFIGHGEPDGLQLYDAREGYTLWTEEAIYTDIDKASFSPPLVYLNACRTLGDSTAFNQFNKLGAAFLSKGTGAVVSMQSDISGIRAAECAKSFYEGIVSDEAIDVALAKARVSVDQMDAENRPGIEERTDAYLPVLLVTGSPEAVLPSRKDLAPPPRKVNIVDETRIDRIVAELVNQDAGRLVVLRSLLDEASTKNVIVVHGAAETGKSWLLGWCIDGWLRRKAQLRYATMSGPADWLQAMLTIVRGQREMGDVGAPLEKAQQIFEKAILTMLSGSRAATLRKNKDWLLSKKDLDSLNIETAAESFHAALSESTEGHDRLLLVLDQFSTSTEQMDPVTFKTLWENWIEGFVIPGNGQIRVVIAVSSADDARFIIPRGQILEVPLEAFPAEHYAELLEELLQARYPKEFKEHRTAFEAELLPIRTQVGHDPIPAGQLSEDCNAVLRWTKRKLQLVNK